MAARADTVSIWFVIRITRLTVKILQPGRLRFLRISFSLMLGSVHPDSVLHLCTQGRFPFDRLVQYYSLREINQAAEDAEKGAIRKPVLRTELE